MARVISLLGKGGTGRSTLTLAMARTEARRGKRVLIVNLEPTSTIGLLLDVPLGGDPQEVEPNLQALHFSTTALIERNWKKLRAAEEEYSRIVLFREVYEQELGVLPGLDQFLAMSALRDWDLSGKYDFIFFDGGSGLDQLRMFAVPEQLGWYVRRFGDALGRSPVGQILAPFFEPITRSLLNISVDTDSMRQTTGRFSDVLNEGRAVMQDPQRLLLYLVATDDPLSVAAARRLWGGSQLLGLTVGGAIVRGDADWQGNFDPLPVRKIAHAPLGDLPAQLEGLADANPTVPAPLVIDEAVRTVRIFLPGLTKKQVELSQYGPELTVRAVDQRRNFTLPASFRTLRASGAKFADGYLNVTFA